MSSNKNSKEKRAKVSLFPYQIKRRDGFYFRNHPKNVHPESATHKNYWTSFLKKVIEGVWINDEGTWVYMMPKLFFYANYPKIRDRNRDLIHPELRDNEWILFTYFLCVDGFSGFDGDDEYTCHYLIAKHERGEKLNFVDLKNIPAGARKPDGVTYKKYIDPWYYLTKHYLIDSPPDKPLGLPLYDNPRRNGVILSARGVGKDQRWDTMVHTQDGPAMIKDIRVGDYIYGGNGRLTKVVDRADYYNQLQYRVEFDDGRVTHCGEGHLWEIYKVGGDGRSYVMPLKEILKGYKGHKRKEDSGKSIDGKRDTVYYVKMCDPVQFPEKDLPIDPYFLGLWLGDGDSNSVGVTTVDEEIKDYCYFIADTYDLKVRVSMNGSKTAPTYYLTKGVGGVERPLRDRFKKLNLLGNKHIPKEYLYASEGQRLELIRGLLDTDGYVGHNGAIEFVQKNVGLTDQFCNLLSSLGIKHYRSEKVLRYFNGQKLDTPKTYQRVRILTGLPVFKLERKLKRIITNPKSKASNRRRRYVGIRNIVPVRVDHSVCLGVENDDRLYLCDQYIVTHNSLTTFVGDFLHEFLTGGIRRMKDVGNINKRLLFGMGSAMKPQLQRSINNVKEAYFEMPGQYKFRDPNKQMYMGSLFKKVQGSWDVGQELNHVVKNKSNAVDLQGSSVQMVALTVDRTTIGAGDRFRRIYVEEFGFLKNAIDVHGANKDSLKSEGVHVGSAIYLGTGGDMQTIRQPKEIFQNPSAYDVFGIPNFWSNSNKKVGLFISKIYALRDYKDEQGNTYIDLAYNAVMEKRDEDREELDSVSFELEIMFNPLLPEEMLRPGNSTNLPKQEAQEQLNKLDAYDIFRRRAQVGKFTWDATEPRGVRWHKDLMGNLKPILETKIDDTTTFTNKEGAVIIYEQPPEYIPEELYWVIYDPAAKSGDGESFHSVIVYKHFYVGSEKTLYDTIVGEWIGRKERLDDNYEMVIQIAKYFNARIFPEINVAGFVEYCMKNNHGTLLEGDAYKLEQEIHGNSAIKRSYYKVGFQMNHRKKHWCLKKLRDWFLEVKEVDAISGIPVVKTMDWIYSPRVLNETIEYVDDPNENFDHISSLLGLMLLLGKLDGKPPVNLEDEDDHRFESQLVPQINYSSNPARSRRGGFLNY